MKLNIRTAKTKLFNNSQVFYVPSKSGGEEHIVVRSGGTLFCDCKDFMTRRLPLLGTAGFSHCTHGKQVAAFSMQPVAPKTRNPKVAKKYAVFTDLGQRSIDLPDVYSSLAQANKAIKYLEDRTGHRIRTARAL